MTESLPPDPLRRTASAHTEPGEPVLGLPIARASALLPIDLIQGDEVIILLLKPSLWYVLLGSLESLGVIAIVTALMIWVREAFHIELYRDDGMLILAGGLAAARLAWQFLEWLSRTYVLTDRRVISVEGVLRIQVFQAELRRIQHTYLLLSLRERVFSLGTIAFSTAGSDIPAAYWVMIRRPLAVQHRIMQAIHRYR